MFNLLFPICFALSALGRTVIAGSPMLRASAHTCSSSNFCEVDSNNYPDMLPMGDISVVSFSIDDLGEWFIAGKENGIGKLWVVSCDLQSYKLVVEKNFSDIEVSPDGSEVYGIADGSVYDVLATNPNEFIEIAPADPTRDYTGVAFDSEHQLLYVTGKASNSVYTFVKNGSSWKPMQGYTNDALQHPTSIRYLQGYIYIRVSNGVARLNFAAGRDQTPVMYTNLGITGDEDFTVAPDNYLYYRHGDDAVYRKPLNDHGHGELYAGGCGCGMNDNQICTAGEGNLVYDPVGSRVVMQDYIETGKFRFLSSCGGFCPQQSSSASLHTTSLRTTLPSTTATATSTTTLTTGSSSVQCDAYCGSITQGSYCKYWLTPSVCEGNNLPCSCDE